MGELSRGGGDPLGDPAVPVEVEVTPIRDAEGSPPATDADEDTADAADAADAVGQPALDARRCGRLGEPLPAGEWRSAWQAPLEAAFSPQRLLVTDDRVLVEAEAWRLLRLEDGEVLADGRNRGAAAALDPERGLAYTVDPRGHLHATRLADGGAAWQLPLDAPRDRRELILGRPGALLVVASEPVKRGPHRAPQPTGGTLTRYALEPSSADPARPGGAGGRLRPAQQDALRAERGRLLAAACGERLALSCRDRVYLIDPSLGVEAALGGSFEPLLCALDGGRLNLVVEAGGQRELWVLRPDGRRLVRAGLPQGLGLLRGLALGRDGSAVVVGAQGLAAFDATGEATWTASPSAEVAGGRRTADGSLLTCEGRAVVAYDSGGARRVLFEAEVPLTAAPALAGGLLLAAGAGRLHALRPVR